MAVSHCNPVAKDTGPKQQADFTIALVGNANVGKSVIFNYLTGLHQHVGNWPGKTVERARGSVRFRGLNLDIVDLPGIYSLSTFSMEELVSRDYIACEKPDVVVNVVDASSLERNLFFTLQLIELGAPVVVALNMMDLAREKGIVIDDVKLSEALGVPVVPVVGLKGIGIDALLEQASAVASRKVRSPAHDVVYGGEIEERAGMLEEKLAGLGLRYPPRFEAVKLLEGDEEVKKEVLSGAPEVARMAGQYREEIERAHGECPAVVISGERYAVANRAVQEAVTVIHSGKRRLIERIDDITTHHVFGYALMMAVMTGVFYAIFTLGGLVSSLIANLAGSLTPPHLGPTAQIFWESTVGGLVAAVTLVLPFVLPFYLLLTMLEDSGYLPRVAFLLDNVMHRMGLHGKAIIPMIMSYGCNVPACYACRIMETGRERLLAAFAVTFVPCTARLVVILGLVAAYVNSGWAFGLLAFDIVLIFLVGRIAFKAFPGETTGLIMELAPLRVPSHKVVLSQTWARIKDIIYMVTPIYVGGGLLLAVLQVTGSLKPVEWLLSPVTVSWLGLPAMVSVFLIFGFVRKELVIVMPAVLLGTTDLAAVFSPVQMIVLSFVTMLYVPCAATFFMLKREFRWKTALKISAFEVALTLVLGGILYRVLALVWPAGL